MMHMSVNDFYKLLELVGPHLIKRSRRRPLTPAIRLAAVLHILAHGGCVTNDSLLFRIGVSTCYALLPEVCAVLSRILIQRYVRFPTKKEWLRIAKEFYEDWNFPNCIGALDGRHFPIEKPPNAGAVCKNYKKFNSLVLLVICDSKKRIIWFNFGDFGSFSDSSIFLQTDIYKKIQANEANIPNPKTLPNSNVQTPFVFVADEIFPLGKHLMKPFARRNNLCLEEKIFNYRLSRARLTVECCFGIMTEKFEILQKPLRFDLKTTDLIVSSVIGLHNFLITENNINNHEIDENYPYIEERENVGYPSMVRNRLKTYFSSPEGAVPWQEHRI